jgi:hypothetical protein
MTTVDWDVTPCSVVENISDELAARLYFPEEPHGATSHKTVTYE